MLNLSLTAAKLCAVMISAPSLGVYFVVDSVCLSVTETNFKLILLFFVSRWNRAIFWPSVSSPCALLQNVVLRFLI